jgi:hypothetical protein
VLPEDRKKEGAAWREIPSTKSQILNPTFRTCGSSIFDFSAARSRSSAALKIVNSSTDSFGSSGFAGARLRGIELGPRGRFFRPLR